MAQGPTIIPPQGPTPTETAAIIIACVWAVLVAVLFWMSWDTGGPRAVVAVLAISLPLALGGLWMMMARELRALTADLAHLRHQLDKAQPVPAAVPVPAPAAARPMATAQLAQKSAPRPAPKPTVKPRVAALDQPGLALGALPDDDTPPLDRPDLIRALNFPENESDTVGFAALHRALRDPKARHLVQASQDVLTFLSQDGIYMDDIRPAPASPDLWRRFAKGERGEAMQDVGGVRDETALTLVTTRMRGDAVFRDVVHHFLRRFDLILAAFETEASDTELSALTETRTARAFMLLGRASRMFD